MDDIVLTEDQVAAMLKLEHRTARKTIQRMARLGILRGQKVGRDWRFHRQAVEDFVLNGARRAYGRA